MYEPGPYLQYGLVWVCLNIWSNPLLFRIPILIFETPPDPPGHLGPKVNISLYLGEMVPWLVKSATSWVDVSRVDSAPTFCSMAFWRNLCESLSVSEILNQFPSVTYDLLQSSIEDPSFLMSLIFNSSSFDPSSSLATSHQSSFWPLMKDADGCVICIESTFFPRKCVYLANRFLIDDSYLGRNILRPQCEMCIFSKVWRGEAHTRNVQTLTAHAWNIHKANGSVLIVTIWCVIWVSFRRAWDLEKVECFESLGCDSAHTWYIRGIYCQVGNICYLPPFARTWRICWNLYFHERRR